MMISLHDLEREVMHGGLMQSTPTIDANKMSESIKILLQEFKNIQYMSTTLQAEMLMLKATVDLLQNENNTYKNIIKKMGKDYPEIVLSHPQFFSEDESIIIKS